MDRQPREPNIIRHWDRYNRPFRGCAYLYIALIFVAICSLLAVMVSPFAF